MPGLRSLVARRRCSLPSPHVGLSDSLLCTYSDIKDSNAKNDSSFVCSSKVVHDDSHLEREKWDISAIFDLNKHKGGKPPNQYEDKDAKFFNKDNNFFSESKPCHNETVAQEIPPDSDSFGTDCTKLNSRSSSPVAMEHSTDCGDSNKTSPERIVIKMKLLHSNSLNDISSVVPDVDCNSEIKQEETSSSVETSNHSTRWTIDSIINAPVASTSDATSMIQPIGNDVDEMHCSNTDKQNELEITVSNSSSTFFRSPRQDKICPEKFHKMNVKNVLPGIQESKELPTPPASVDSTRRSSDSSDISESSACSELSSSSTSSVKSCSIIIKRLQNSNIYSCHRSPRSKRRKSQGQGSLKSRLCIRAGCLPVLYIPKNVLVEEQAKNFVPCSVILCDIFCNAPLSDLQCPCCFQYFNVEKDIFINIIKKTIHLVCQSCDWLVVHRLIPHDICLPKV